jgi:hypothetical protein
MTTSIAKSGAKSATKAATATAAATKKEIIKIHVKFTLNTPDGLRRVMFELEKLTQAEVVKWKIIFQMFERAKKSDPFGDAIVDLLVEVDAKLNKKAETMANAGMTPNQAAYAIGPGADKSQAANESKAKLAVQNTLNK